MGWHSRHSLQEMGTQGAVKTRPAGVPGVQQGQLIPEGKPIHWMGVGKADACSGRCSSSKFHALKQG